MRESKSPFVAIRAHWRLVVFSAVLLMALGVGLAAARPATYSSTATLRLINTDEDQVDTTTTTNTADPGRNIATQTVLIQGDNVINAAAKSLGRTPDDVRNSLTVSQSQFGDTLDIAASGSTAAVAQATAAAVSKAYVDSSTATTKQRLQNTVAGLSTQLSTLQVAATDKTADDTDRTSAQQAYASLNTVYQDKLAQLKVLQPDVVLVRSPDLSGAPSSLSRGKAGVLGLVLGLLFGIGVAIVRANTVDRVLDEDDLVQATGLRVLALVPEDATLHRNPVLHGPARSGRFVDSIRRLHQALPEPVEGGSGLSILITGDARGQGRSILAANLAYTAGQSGARVILVTADLRSPGADAWFDEALHTAHPDREDGADPGLADILALSEATKPDARLRLLRERLPKLLLSSEATKVQILPGGRGSPTAIDLIQARNLEPIIQALCELADLVIIDAPTFTTPEALALASATDLTLLAVSVGKRTSSRQRLIRRLPTLVGSAKHVAAVALTARGADLRHGDYPEPGPTGRAFSPSQPGHEQLPELALPAASPSRTGRPPSR